MKAEVNVEALDVIDTDTIPELGVGIPSATPTMKAAMSLINMSLRNKMVNDRVNKFSEINNDAGTVIAKAAFSDDGTLFTREKLQSG